MNRRGPELAPRSKRVLAQGRRIASHLGATLYAVASENDVDNDGWITEAGLAGADKIVLLSFGAEPSEALEPDGDVGPGHLAAALHAVCDALTPTLVLFVNDSLGSTLARASAAHIDAELFLNAEPLLTDNDDIAIEERTVDRLQRRLGGLATGGRRIVATLATAGVAETVGRDDADVIFFKAPSQPIELPAKPDLGTAEVLDGEVVVCAGSGARAVLDDVRSLARTLGAPLVYTEALSEELARRGEPFDAPTVASNSRHIASRLYFVCGATPAESHLAAISPSTQIVAVSPSPKFPAVRASRYGLLGPLAVTIPALSEAVAAFPRSGHSESHAATSVFRSAGVVAPSSSEPSPVPGAVELFSAPRSLLEQLSRDRLWSP